MPRMRATPTATLVAVTGSAGVRLTDATGVVVGVEVGPALDVGDEVGIGVGVGSPVEGTTPDESFGVGCEGTEVVGDGVGVGVAVGFGAT
jgi:hypothetical protein